MKLILLIGIGGFLGAVSRYLLSIFIHNKILSTYPYGTLTVNILGCLLIGMVYAMSDKGALSVEWRLFLATGLLGGFTTFSSFSNETVSMLRDGEYLFAFSYVTASVILGIVATFGGIFLIKSI